MLTIKQITENTEAVLRGLEKKHFKNAKETIDHVIALNDKRRSTQNELDKNLAEVNSLSRTIGQLMKEGKKEEAETARARVAELKEGNKELDAAMTQAATDMQNVLYTIPNIPYDSVPEGVGAEEIHGLLVQKLLIGVFVHNVCRNVAYRFQCAVVNGGVHFHAAGINHGAQQGVFRQLIVIEQYRNALHFQGGKPDEGQVAPVTYTFCHRHTDA